jgi:hypothetical protein
MFAFGLMLFFAVTGFMLNHEDWFLPRQTTTGKVPANLLGPPADREAILDLLRSDYGVAGEPVTFDDGADFVRVTFRTDDGGAEAIIRRDDRTAVVTADAGKSRERVVITEGVMPADLLVPDDPSKELPIVERLRKDFGARGEVNSPPHYEKESESFSVVFRSPGYLATATIRASDGHTRVTHQSRGINGVLLDLHRGKDSGLSWSLVIDAVALFFVVVSITGLILWSSLRGRAQQGLAVLSLGLVGSLVIYLFCVPR